MSLGTLKPLSKSAIDLGPHVRVTSKFISPHRLVPAKMQFHIHVALPGGQRWKGTSKLVQVLILFQIALFYLLEEHLNKYEYTFIITNIINVI